MKTAKRIKALMDIAPALRGILSGTVVLAGVIIATAPANAAPIAVANGDFEAPLFDEDGAGGDPDWYWVPDWNEGGASYVTSDTASYGWSGAGRVLYLDSGGWVDQNLGYNWTAADVFTLGVKGNQGWRAGGTFKIKLRQADGTVLWDSGTIPVTSTVNNFNWNMNASTFSGAGVVPGSQLNLRIECLNATVYLDDVTLSTPLTDATLLTFGVSGYQGIIDQVAKTVTMTVGPAMNVANLAPTYTVASGTGAPVSGSTRNFTNPVIYTITDGAAVNHYTVTINVDSTAPTVTNVTSANSNTTYIQGQVIDLSMTFSEPVVVTGAPTLALETGTIDRQATYQGGSGTNTLTFRYTVQTADSSLDLDYAGTAALALNGGTIRDTFGNDATLALPAPGAAGSLGANKNLVVDGTRTYVMLVNEDFQNPVQPQGAEANFSGWTMVTAASIWTVKGGPDGAPGTPDNQMLYIHENGPSNAAQYDISHPWSPGETYALKMNVGPSEWSGTIQRYFVVELLQQDGSLLWTSGDVAIPLYNNYGGQPWPQDLTYTFAIQTDNFTNGLAGQPLRLRFYSSNSGRRGLYLDNLTLQVASPPDADGDGIPDWFELLHTTPASPTALSPGDDPDSDGLTNLQEFQLRTDPNLPDTDGDGLLDGANITVSSVEPRYTAWAAAGITFTQSGAQRTFRGEAPMGTNPTMPDTDGDSLLDGVETNTGIWVSAADTGTDPLNPDTDGDGLRDNVETNTGTYVSATDTGTSPLLADTDGDGAGDWYEITASFTNPFLASSKPNIPYPLPDPDSSSGATNKPVKVYIMSGQSNMVGFGRFKGPATGTLQTIVQAENKFPNLVDGAGAWNVRNDVRYRGVISAIGNNKLAPGFGANTNSFGPELGFGQVMGWYHDEPVLLIKTSIGNRSLLWDCLPPGSPRFNYNGNTYAGYGDSPNSWPIGGSPSPSAWYAGKQYDDYFLAEADMGTPGWAAGLAYPNYSPVRRNGVAYMCKSAHTSDTSSEPGVGVNWATYWDVYSVFNVTDILDNWAAEYTGTGKPYPSGQDFEIAGYVWWQGYGDQSEPAATRYRENMARFITQTRAYYENRYPTKTQSNAPFVLATLAADGGWSNPNPLSAKVAQAQLDVAGDVSNVKTIEARDYWRNTGPSTEGYHYNHNAETYMLVGDALGRAMVELQGNVTPPGDGYAGWIDGQFAGTLADPNPTLDFDKGGLETGIEWVVGGDPTDGSDDAGLAPTLDTTSDPDGKVLFVFRRSTEAAADANTSINVEYGSNLNGWTTAVHQGTGASEITITAETNGFGAGIDKVTVALPANLAAGGKLFARLKVAVTTP